MSGFGFQIPLFPPLQKGDERGIFPDSRPIVATRDARLQEVRGKAQADKRNKVMASKKADFRTFYRDAHAVECLTDREKMLIGLTVAMMRLCDP